MRRVTCVLFDDDATELSELGQEVADRSTVPVPVCSQFSLRNEELPLADGRNPFGVDILWPVVRACLVQHVEVSLET